jgi:hypothetical protein
MKLLPTLAFAALSFHASAVDLVCPGTNTDVSKENYFVGSNTSYTGTYYISFNDDLSKLTSLKSSSPLNRDPNKKFSDLKRVHNVNITNSTITFDGMKKDSWANTTNTIKGKLERTTGQLIIVDKSEGDLVYKVTFIGNCTKTTDTKF